MNLRTRITLTLVPLFALLALLGAAGIFLLSRLGNRIDLILRENYDSVLFMKDLNEALERIDSSFAFQLIGEAERARGQYDASWQKFEDNLHREQRNITLPGERELVERLTDL